MTPVDGTNRPLAPGPDRERHDARTTIMTMKPTRQIPRPGPVLFLLFGSLGSGTWQACDRLRWNGPAGPASIGRQAEGWTRSRQKIAEEEVIWQRESFDCGDAAIAMIFRHFGLPWTYGDVRRELMTPPTGSTMSSLKSLAEQKGLACAGWRLQLSDLGRIPLPAIIFILRNHYAVLAEFDEPHGAIVLDPARGRLHISSRRLASLWRGEILLFSNNLPAPGPWFSRADRPQKVRD